MLIESKKLIIEYDGRYWHDDKDWDIERDNELIVKGYKIIHYVDLVPSLDRLQIDIEDFLRSGSTSIYYE